MPETRGSKKTAAYAAEQGNIKTVIHAAGVSPHMTSGGRKFCVNAVGTININEECCGDHGRRKLYFECIINVGYMLPQDKTPTQIYRLALSDTAAFQGAAAQMIAAVPEERQTGMAYTVSKNFVVWYTAKMAVKYGKKGIRVVSISPGTFKTPMGEVEGEEAAAFALRGALGRLGDATEEIAKMMAFMVSDACSYLTGVDILYDGGTIAAVQEMMSQQA